MKTEEEIRKCLTHNENILKEKEELLKNITEQQKNDGTYDNIMDDIHNYFGRAVAYNFILSNNK